MLIESVRAHPRKPGCAQEYREPVPSQESESAAKNARQSRASCRQASAAAGRFRESASILDTAAFFFAVFALACNLAVASQTKKKREAPPSPGAASRPASVRAISGCRGPRRFGRRSTAPRSFTSTVQERSSICRTSTLPYSPSSGLEHHAEPHKRGTDHRESACSSNYRPRLDYHDPSPSARLTLRLLMRRARSG